jgi:hypothetical protein
LKELCALHHFHVVMMMMQTMLEIILSLPIAKFKVIEYYSHAQLSAVVSFRGQNGQKLSKKRDNFCLQFSLYCLSCVLCDERDNIFLYLKILNKILPT